VFLDEANDGDWSQEEHEANRFAEEWLIPAEAAHELPQLKSKDAVRQFARRIGIHPGIVVGRLQHEKFIDPSWMNDLRATIALSGGYEH
jgi:HTH-type transcriptional regulator/antitoxin HigA